MENEVKYMTFYENWVELMEECTPEEWYELCKIITNLRFKGIDTDTKTIKNLKIRMAWTLIRPSIKKSNRNTRYNNKNKAEKTTNLTASNTPNDISNQTTKENCPDGLKMANTMDIPSEFAIPIPEVNEPVVDEGEIDDTGEFYYEWETECERLIKDAMIDTLEGNGYAMRECNNKLQEIYNVCVANGCSEVLLSQIKDNVRERVSNEVEKEYNEKVA